MRQLPVLFALFAVVACTEKDPVGGLPFEAQELRVPAAAGSAQSNLATGPDGTGILSWLEPDGDDYALRFSVLEDGGWSAPGTVAQDSEWFVNWADFPSVVPAAHDLWAAHWLQKTPGNVYSYDVQVSLSHDRGKSWDLPLTPHTDGTATEHGFVTLFPQENGVAAIWLDGRKTAESEHGETVSHDDGSSEHGMTLRAVVIQADATLSQGQEIDGLVCDCCQTNVATTEDGPVVVYRDRSENEIRDIYVSRYLDGRWQTGVPVAEDNWQIGGCPVNGPAIAANQSTVAVAWFTAAEGVSRAKLAFSTDSAATFGEPLVIDAKKVLGRVGVALLPDGNAAVSWMKNIGDGRAEIRLQRFSQYGPAGPLHIIAETSSARISGFPQLIATRDSLLLAWTDITDGKESVRSTRVSFAGL